MINKGAAYAARFVFPRHHRATCSRGFAGSPEPRPPGRASGRYSSPNGKSQQEEILKAEHEKTLKDATALIELAEQLKADLEKNDRHVLSVATLKKTEEIEKLAKRIRTRLHH